MKADKSFYLKYRNLFIQWGFWYEVKQLDIHFNIVLVYNKEGQLIKLI
jgi:hypothetical protein